MAGRKPLSKKLRFEVFKRDKFTCQYCGKSAPDVVLEVDHIKPVSKGGSNDILNLITSCKDCNRGKSATELSDDSTIKKQQKQLQELAERNEQLEMMIEWRNGLNNLNQKAVKGIADYLRSQIDYELNENDTKIIKKLIHKFSYKEICEAIDIAVDYYYDYTNESVDLLISKLSGICFNNRKQQDGFKGGAYGYWSNYVIKALRQNYAYFDESKVRKFMDDYVTQECDFDRIKWCLKAKNWHGFCENVSYEFEIDFERY